MKKSIISIALITLSSVAFAYGTYESSWLDGTEKICKYSDGSILKVGMSESCPISN